MAVAVLSLCRGSIYALPSGPHGDIPPGALSVLAGTVYAEELSEEETERLERLKSRRMKINIDSESRLMESGLFSRYQVASLVDYRYRHGDILSLAELAAVDGFGHEFAEAVEPFVSFVSAANPGESSSKSPYLRNTLVMKTGIKLTGDPENGGQLFPEHTYGLKYKLSVNDVAEVAVSGRSSYGAGLSSPEDVSFYAVYYGRGALGKIIVGDFNTRFGQGLGMWSGFSMSGAPVQGAFSKHPSGISPCWSFSGDGSHRGVAADISFGDITVSPFLSFPGSSDLLNKKEDIQVSFLPGVNIAWTGMHGQASLTCFTVSRPLYVREDGSKADGVLSGMPFFEAGKLSADFRYTVNGTEIFSEAALDLPSFSFAAIAGCKFRPCDALGLAVGVRYYPADFSPDYSGAMRSGSKCSNEYGIAFSGAYVSDDYVRLAGRTGFGSSVSRHQGSFSVDMSHSPEPKYGVHEKSSQIKAVLSYMWRISGAFGIDLKISERVRTYGRKSRTDVRCDLEYLSENTISSLRVNVLRCAGTGFLSYAECGYKSDSGHFSAWARGGVFLVDEWDDRIYAYERDAPGNFTVPAYYGRGFWLSAVAGFKAGRWGRFYLRASYTGYPWQTLSGSEKKPGKAELKVQMMFDM